MLTPRENLLRAIRKENPEYVPLFLNLCQEQENNFFARTGSRDYLSYFDIPVRYINLRPSRHPADYSRYYPSLPANTVIDEYGVGQESHGFKHFTKMLHPMEDFTTPEEVYEFPLPDMLADYRWEGLEQEVQRIHDEGYAAMFHCIMVFEYTWYLRGLENLLCDMITDEEMAAACLDRMTRFQAQIAAKMAAIGVDIIVFGDDVGTQNALMMSKEQWRRWIKPTTRAVIQAAKQANPQVLCYYHSDGNIFDIIDELIEVGVDILNPIQPECMDPIRIKELYGDKLAFWGTIGTQTTMPFGTPQQVEQTVKIMIETVGKGGGFVAAPTHLLEPEVPWENIEALAHAVKKYGKYSW